MYSRFIEPYLAAREQIYLLLRDSKWMITIALLLSVILVQPDQIKELYRVFSADITFISFTLHDAIEVGVSLIKFFIPLVAIALLVWFGVNQVTVESIGRMTAIAPATNDVARLLPPLLGALPLLAAAAGQFLASPHFSSADGSSELPAGPWDKFGQQLADTVGRGLFFSGLFTLGLCIAVAVLGWKWSQRLRLWSCAMNRHYFRRIRFYVVSIAAIGVLTVAVLLLPVVLPQAIGVFGILALFALCLIAFCVHLSLLTIRYRLPFIPALCAFALLLAFLDTNDDHDVRELKLKPSNAAAANDSLPGAAQQFEKWYNSRPGAAKYAEYPVYVVAAQGGGIYAAYQTAIFLARMHDYCPAFNDHLFAISSVSGGSFGAAAYAAAVKSLSDERAPPQVRPGGGPAAVNPCPNISEYYSAEQPLRNDLDWPGPLEIKVRKMFASDFLSPLVSAMLFPEFSQAFIPVPIRPFDRARALEFAFERSESVLHTDDKRYLTTNFEDHWTPDGNVPALIVNSTDAASGRRIVMSPFEVGGNKISNVNSIISYRDLGRDNNQKVQTAPPVIRLSTAAGISARFPWVTPAATIPVGDARLGKSKKIRLVDGGYVDNSGVETALNLLESIRPSIDSINKPPPGRQLTGTTTAAAAAGKVRIKLIVLSGGDYPVRTTFALGEILEPIRALLSTRASRAYVAIDTAARQFPPRQVTSIDDAGRKISIEVSDLRHASLNSRFYPLPLGWAMSNRTRQIIEKQSGHFWECEAGLNFTQSQESLSETDCIQLLIYHELNQSVASAATEIAIASRLDPSGRAAARLPHDELIQCYIDSSDPTMSRPQAQAFEALLRNWDSHPEWKDDRLLTLMVATIASETADFQVRSDILSIASAERIRSLWPTRFPAVADAAPFVNNPQLLAEQVYSGRFGNVEPGDGWLYRERGLAMLLGREEYGRYGGMVGLDLIANPDWVLIPAVGARIAFAAYFPPSTIAAVSDIFLKNPDHWPDAIRAVPRVSDRDDIETKSKLLFDCIRKVAPARTAG